jgi:hypothetical protein
MVCEGNEDSVSCEIDCPVPVCGNGTCDIGEDASSCCSDCATINEIGLCTDSLDNDCDGLTDGADLDDCSGCVPTHSKEKGRGAQMGLITIVMV